MSDTIATFPGILDMESVSIDFQKGINPSSASIVAPYSRVQVNLNPIGDLRVFWRGNEMFRWPNAQVQSQSLTVDSGHFLDFVIVDRRWRWQFAEISGWYNRRKEDSEDIRAGSEKTPRELASILLDAMGETAYDVSALPDSDRPECKWEHDGAASELEKLCSDLGCEIVLRLTNNRVVIVKQGQGTACPILPDFLKSPSVGHSNIIKPAKIAVYSGPLEVDTTWPTEAVGENRDGKFVPVDQLDYKPDDGFPLDPGGWGTADKKDAEKARKTVWKYYRIKGPPDEWPQGLTPPPVARCEFESETLLTDSTGKRLEAEFRGKHWPGDLGPNQTGPDALWDDGFTVDAKRRFVTTTGPCVLAGDNIAPAEMKLRTTCKPREEEGHYTRLSVEVDVPGGGQGVKAIVRDEIRWRVRLGTDEDIDTTDQVREQLTKLAEHERDKYVMQVGGAGVYAGIHAFDLDGLRTRVAWQWSASQGPTTTLTCETETNPYLPDEAARKKNRALDRMFKRAQQRELESVDERK